MRNLLCTAAILASLVTFVPAATAQEPTAAVESPAAHSQPPYGSPGPELTLLDSFTRTVLGGWGQPDVGEAWDLTEEAAAASSVDGSSGLMVISDAQHGVFADLPTSARDLEITGRWMVSELPRGSSLSIHLWSRVPSATDHYRFYWLLTPEGELSARFALVSDGQEPLPLGSGSILGSYSAGDWWHVKVETAGQDPTWLRARFWKDGEDEPTSWQVETSDATPSLQGASRLVKIGAYLNAGATSVPMEVAFDDLIVIGLPPEYR